MKVLLAAAAVLAVASAGAVQAQGSSKTDRSAEFQAKMEQQRIQSMRTKVGIQPRSPDEIRADRLAKAAREGMVRQASRDTHQRHEEAFSQVDADRNGRLDIDEFKEAALQLEGAPKAKLP